MSSKHEQRLENAVKVLSCDVYEKIHNSENQKYSEKELWEELICCVLSSQITYEIARAYAKHLTDKRLIGQKSTIYNLNKLEISVRNVLNKPIMTENRKVSYRFPNIRARQIAKIHQTVNNYGTSLSKIIYSENDPHKLRELLINNFSGIGPKQASMFIRNIGLSYELAILDKHVINYMHVTNISKGISNLGKKEYFSVESELINYANDIGYPVGFVDWAIWIVMRVARREGYV